MERETPVDDLGACRRSYAEKVCATAGVADTALVEAFATVPRERFLGPGPWSIVVPDHQPRSDPYELTPSDDPAWLYADVLVAVDRRRNLNNGHPSSLALWIAALELRPGESVVHVGAGVGYFTALLAEIVGPTGRVTAIEIDADLAARATANLADRPWVEVVHGDGSQVPAFDAMLVSAGCTAPRDAWLDGMAEGGRLLVPLTFQRPPMPSTGILVRIRRIGGRYPADCISRVGIYDCDGAREAEGDAAVRALVSTMEAEGIPPVRSLVRSTHEKVASCLIHTRSCCLSSA